MEKIRKKKFKSSLTSAEIGTKKPNTELINIPHPRKPSDPYFFAKIPNGIYKKKFKKN